MHCCILCYIVTCIFTVATDKIALDNDYSIFTIATIYAWLHTLLHSYMYIYRTDKIVLDS